MQARALRVKIGIRVVHLDEELAGDAARPASPFPLVFRARDLGDLATSVPRSRGTRRQVEVSNQQLRRWTVPPRGSRWPPAGRCSTTKAFLRTPPGRQRGPRSSATLNPDFSRTDVASESGRPTTFGTTVFASHDWTSKPKIRSSIARFDTFTIRAPTLVNPPVRYATTCSLSGPTQEHTLQRTGRQGRLQTK